MNELYVIEARDPDGKLDLRGPQPESVFGNAAITGITEEAMARTVFRHKPEACLRGDDLDRWPSLIDPRWIARRKYW